MTLNLTNLEKAIESLETAIRCSRLPQIEEVDKKFPEVLRAAVIQNFEFTFELCWRILERWLGEKLGTITVKGLSHKKLFRLAGERLLIDNPAHWFTYVEARNKTSHSYNVLVAEDVYAKAIVFLEDAKQLLKNLQRGEESEETNVVTKSNEN